MANDYIKITRPLKNTSAPVTASVDYDFGPYPSTDYAKTVLGSSIIEGKVVGIVVNGKVELAIYRESLGQFILLKDELAPDIHIDTTTYNWVINGVDTGVSALGVTGDTGQTGALGPTGDPGENGLDLTIVGITTEYNTSMNGVTPPVSGWSSTIPAPQQGYYFWVKTVTQYSDESINTQYNVSYYGTDGSIGETGADGFTTHFAYALSADGSEGFSTTNFPGATYIGTYRDDIPEDSEDYTDYTWTEWRGEQGATGATGETGATGDTGATGEVTVNLLTRGYPQGQRIILKLNSTSTIRSGYTNVQTVENLSQNKIYVVSFYLRWAEHSSPAIPNKIVFSHSTGEVLADVLLSDVSENQRIEIPFIPAPYSNTKSYNIRLYSDIYDNLPRYTTIYKCLIEEGSTATTWQPGQLDVVENALVSEAFAPSRELDNSVKLNLNSIINLQSSDSDRKPRTIITNDSLLTTYGVLPIATSTSVDKGIKEPLDYSEGTIEIGPNEIPLVFEKTDVSHLKEEYNINNDLFTANSINMYATVPSVDTDMKLRCKYAGDRQYQANLTAQVKLILHTDDPISGYESDYSIILYNGTAEITDQDDYVDLTLNQITFDPQNQDENTLAFLKFFYKPHGSWVTTSHISNYEATLALFIKSDDSETVEFNVLVYDGSEDIPNVGFYTISFNQYISSVDKVIYKPRTILASDGMVIANDSTITGSVVTSAGEILSLS